MTLINVKGHEFNAFNVKDSSTRRAIQFRNNIIESLKKLGITEDDIDVPLETLAFKRAPASALWFIDGHRLYYSYSLAEKFVENLYVVAKVIELEVKALVEERKTFEEFAADFTEDKNVEEQRKKARALLGVSHDSKDMDLINKKYKELAKEHHPDMPGGNTEKFKAINHAHKTLKRELE